MSKGKQGRQTPLRDDARPATTASITATATATTTMLLSSSALPGLARRTPSNSAASPALLPRRRLIIKVALLFSLSLLSAYLFTTLYVIPTLRITPVRSFHWALPTEERLSLLFPTWLHVPLSVIFARDAPSVRLRQGTVLGKTLADSSYPRAVEAFLGIPYALPPTGKRRFAPPEPVGKGDGEIDASKYGKRCPSKPLSSLNNDWSEDCLTANVFRPQHTSNETKLPVAVYIHGGAFNSGSGRGHDDASMLAWSEEPYIAVSFNYRLGAFGFLGSSVAARENAVNLGLRDQILLLEWVQDNIAAFGGDPDEVTLFGVSAGAHAVGHHIMNYDSHSKPLFHRAMLESGATTSRAVYPYDAHLPENQFDQFLSEAGCADLASEKDIMPCLRSKSAHTIAQASINVYDYYDKSIRWAFQPVIDGKIIKKAPIHAWEDGKWKKIPILTGFNTNEGSPFVPRDLDTSAAFADFFNTLIPKLPPSDLKTLDKLYPDPLVDPESPYVEDRSINVGSQFKRVEAAYAHYAYVCPVKQTAHHSSFSSQAPVYLYHWALNKSLENGAGHGDQVEYEVYSPNVRRISPAQEKIAGYFHDYLTSFITRGDPNAVKGKYADRPRWEKFEAAGRDKDGKWVGQGKEKVMVFGKGNDERAGGKGTGVAAQLSDDTWSARECDFWSERSILSES